MSIIKGKIEYSSNNELLAIMVNAKKYMENAKKEYKLAQEALDEVELIVISSISSKIEDKWSIYEDVAFRLTKDNEIKYLNIEQVIEKDASNE